MTVAIGSFAVTIRFNYWHSDSTFLLNVENEEATIYDVKIHRTATNKERDIRLTCLYLYVSVVTFLNECIDYDGFCLNADVIKIFGLLFHLLILHGISLEYTKTLLLCQFLKPRSIIIYCSLHKKECYIFDLYACVYVYLFLDLLVTIQWLNNFDKEFAIDLCEFRFY